MKKLFFSIVALFLLSGCSLQEKQVNVPEINSTISQEVQSLESTGAINTTLEDTKPTINTNLECDGAGCIDYDNFLGGVSKEIAKLVSICDNNLWSYKDYYGNQQSMDKLFQDMKLDNQEAINHIKNIDLLNEYYSAINDQKYDYALSLTTGSIKDANGYAKVYSGYSVWIGTDRGEIQNKYTYKGNNTYYFGVIISSYSGGMIYNELYGITKQIENGKIKSVGNTLISKYETPEGVGDKPVIYLYPTKTTAVSVKLDIKGKLSTTYPEIGENNIRNIIANPNGIITNTDNTNIYSYLFWDAKKMKPWKINEGFIVEKKNYVSFLQEKLNYLGLIPNEYNEFIVYRLPIMNQYPYVAIKFAGDDYTDQAKLTITPKPDSIQRVFMVFKGIKKPISLPEQKLQQFTRKGFSVIEWGGAQTH